MKMKKQMAIAYMMKGKKLVSDDIGFNVFYITYKDNRFVDHMGNVVNINEFNGNWNFYKPTLLDRIRMFIRR